MAINYTFEWDSRKAHDNRDKHNVAFDEAATVEIERRFPYLILITVKPKTDG
jgi:uncharacterized DUF497 family protein